MLLLPRNHRASIALTVLVAACSQDARYPMNATLTQLNPQAPEEEFFGMVFENGHPTTSTAYAAQLIPFNSATASRLRFPQESTMFVGPDPLSTWMYGWYDPKGGGGCGDLPSYLSGDTTHRLTEAHRSAPGQPPPNHKERHCLRPGTYDFSVTGGPEGNGMTYRVDYLQIAVDGSNSPIIIDNATAGVQENTDPQTYDEVNKGLSIMQFMLTSRPEVGRRQRGWTWRTHLRTRSRPPLPTRHSRAERNRTGFGLARLAALRVGTSLATLRGAPTWANCTGTLRPIVTSPRTTMTPNQLRTSFAVTSSRRT